MDNLEKTQEFSLDDIIKEFGSGATAESAEVMLDKSAEEILGALEAELQKEPAEVVAVEETAAEPVESEPVQTEAVSEQEDDASEQEEDTSEQESDASEREEGSSEQGEEVPAQLEDEPASEEEASAEKTETAETDSNTAEEPEEVEEGVSGDTIRLDDLSEVHIETEVSAEDIDELDLIEEFIPPPPIIFRPRSRLKELKRQLVAGPEKRYYELSEIGVGKVQAAIFLSILVVILCAGATVMYAMGMVPENRLRLIIFSQVLAMMVSALLGSYLLLDGATDLIKGKFSLNTMLLFTLIVCLADAYYCLETLRVPCCAAFSLEMTFALYNRYLRRATEMGQMDTLRKAVRLNCVKKVKDYYDGRPGIFRGEGEVADFMDHYADRSGPDKVQSVFCMIVFLACIGIAVFAGILHGIVFGVQICATSLLVAVPASFFVTLSRPAAILQRRLHMVGAVICGWQGVKGLCGAAAFPLRDGDIFPNGSTKLNGVKFYGERNPDETIAYASALINACGGGLEPAFTQLRKSRSCAELTVDVFQSYGNGGIGGEVSGEPVLLGTLNFIQEMGVDIPEGTMVNQAVYCAVDGQLCAVFAISYAKMKSSAAGLVTLCSHRKLTPVILCGDFMLTESFLRSKFGINTRRLAFPNRESRLELEKRTIEDDESIALALTTQEGLISTAYAVAGARTLRTTCRLGLAIHMLSGVVGVLIMLALAYLGSDELLTPFNILLYQLVWMVPGLLISEWARTV